MMRFLVRCTAFLLAVIISLLSVAKALTKPSTVTLEDNEYTGIVVAIHESVPVNSELINVIKRMFVQASPYLYTATKKRAFFKEVTILVPTTWPDDASYQAATRETFDSADIVIAPQNPRFSSPAATLELPYTKHFEGCGKQAMYIHFTPDFLLDDSLEDNHGSFGRVLVNQWGHFRWGLFNEYPDPVGDVKPEYFYQSNETGLFEPVVCPRLWSVTPVVFIGEKNRPFTTCNGNPQEGYEEDCRFIPDSTQSEFSASIMFGLLNIDQITQFCDNDIHDRGTLHNSGADNKHNRLCGGRSCWEVMREHEDFRDGANPAREIDDVQPTFRVVRVKESGRPIVLVLDTSGSMSTSNRANRLASAVRSYLTTTISDGCRVGIIDFNDRGTVLSTLREIDSATTRQQLAGLIVGDANGGTCIGCGIQAALNIIPPNESGKIILVTDGEDGNSQVLRQMEQECIDRGIVVDSIAYSNSAHRNIFDLASRTGGRAYHQTDYQTSTGAREAYHDNSACSGSSSSSSGRIVLLTKVFELAASETAARDSISIDSTVGRETKFIFSYEESNEGIQISLTSPSGLTLDSSYGGYERNEIFKTITFSIDGVVEAGPWRFTIRNQDGREHVVTVSVSSLPSQEGVEPIVIRSFLSGTDADVTDIENPLVAYAEVTQGFYPIILARVIATIERPRTADGRDLGPVEIVLQDNGGGFDVTKNDGIYTKAFTSFTGVGYYGISVRVESSGEAKVLTPNVNFNLEDLRDGKESLQGNPDVYELPSRSNTAPDFTRSVSAGAARVLDIPVGWTPESDVLPPSKITDLSISSSDFESATVTFEFTAPGDDFDSGTATSYVILRSNSLDQLKRQDLLNSLAIDDTDVTYGSLSSPSQFGSKEMFFIRVPIQEGQTVASFFFAVFAEDEQGHRGELSNIAQATLRENIPPPTARCETKLEWKEFNDQCYKMLYLSPRNEGGDFDEMLDACRSEGPRIVGKVTRIAHITSSEENDFVANTVATGSPAWIGAKRQQNAVGYSNWESDVPNTQANVDSCIGINQSQLGKWNDNGCHHRLPVICKYSLSP